MAVEGFRLPKASNVYRGIEFTAIAEANGSIAPFARNTHVPGGKGTLRVRFTLAGFGTEYVLHPHCVGSTDSETRVALYVAVNPRGARTSGDYYVGPDDVDRFAEHAATFAMAAGQLYGISGKPRPYEVHTAIMIDNAMHGRPVDALISFSKAWREALKDPVWYVMAVPAVLGASIAGGARAPVGATAAGRALPSEIEMLRMISADGQLERGLLVRELKGRYLIRVEGVADIGPGDFFNGPYKSLPEARAAAQRLASSETALRQGNALARNWRSRPGEIPRPPLMPAARPAGPRPSGLVVRIYQVESDSPGIQSVISSQPEGGKVMVRPEHREAIRTGDPAVAHEYKGGNTQLELPVKGMRKTYNIEIVKRVDGGEFPVKPDGTGF